MSDFIFTEDGLDDYIYWQTQDKKTLRKINALLNSLRLSSGTFLRIYQRLATE